MQDQFEDLALNIKKMKNKIKFKKHKTETSNLLDKLNASGVKQKNTFKCAPFFPHIY